MAEPMIELEGVSLWFGDRRVIDHLDLTIHRGETTVIIGRGGSGKSVLLKLMIGLIAPTRGHVRVFGHDLAAASPIERVALRKRMAMQFQNYALFDAVSVEDNIEFPLRESLHEPANRAAQRAREIIAMLGLADSEALLPAELSGGMKRRVSLARALVVRPELVLLDEPTTGLDPILVEKVDRLIANARRQAAITPVIVSHDMASVARLADRVAFLHDGAILFTGSYPQFIASELAPIRAFIDTALVVRPPARPPAVDRPVIELAQVHKRFGDKQVLRGVDLAIQPGRITTLIGASGSGKSVLIRHLLGWIKPDRGTIRVLGKEVTALGEHELEELRSHVGLVFQHAGLLDWLDVEANVAFPLVAHRVAPAQVRARTDALVEQLGLTELRRRMPGELSTGERKRVAIARALVTRPDILIYDEPTTGQDPVRTREIDDLIVHTQHQFATTTIVISHDMASTFRISHTVAMLHDGVIAACGSPDELRGSSNEHVRRFLAASTLALCPGMGTAR